MKQWRTSLKVIKQLGTLAVPLPAPGELDSFITGLDDHLYFK